jgi:hypothetical protein
MFIKRKRKSEENGWKSEGRKIKRETSSTKRGGRDSEERKEKRVCQGRSGKIESIRKMDECRAE